jgi:membrane protease YdiL (CAAX protease family)
MWTVLLCLWFGLPGFVILLNWLPRIWPLEAAALGIGTGITLGCLVLLGIVRWWLPRAGLSLATLGWNRPVTAAGLIAALLVAAFWLALSFFGFSTLMPDINLWALSPARVYAGLTLAFAGCVEELIGRGIVMTRLQQAGVAAWAQL